MSVQLRGNVAHIHAGPTRGGRHVAVLLSADSVALGIWDDGLLARHKVVTGYTVRRKAGKAQLTYLRRCVANEYHCLQEPLAASGIPLDWCGALGCMQ